MHLETYCGFLSIQTILSVSFLWMNCYQRSAFYWLFTFCSFERLTSSGKLQANATEACQSYINWKNKSHMVKTELNNIDAWYLAEAMKSKCRNVDICSSNCLPLSPVIHLIVIYQTAVPDMNYYDNYTRTAHTQNIYRSHEH